MLRKFRQWVAGAEINAMGTDLEKLADLCATNAHRVEGLQLRLERLANRVNMRLNRAGAPRDEDRDAQILEDIRTAQQGRAGFEDDPFFRQ